MIRKVISGGQTGVDRAALDVAMELGYEVGGWCPAGRWAEDGPIDARYPLRETAEREVEVRTKLNVRDADATMVLMTRDGGSADTRGGGSAGPRDDGSAGTEWTLVCAEMYEKPVRVVFVNPAGMGLSDAAQYAMAEVAAWLRQNDVEVLNVAGPRESEAPGIYNAAADFLRELLITRSDS